AVDTATGNVFAAGYVASAAATASHDIWLAKFNASLTLLSTVTVDGSAADMDEAAAGRISPSGLYLVGVSSQAGGQGFWLAKYDTSLVMLSSVNYTQLSPYAWDVMPTAGGIFITGSRAPNWLVSNDTWIGKFSQSLVFVASAAVNGPSSNSDEVRGMA